MSSKEESINESVSVNKGKRNKKWWIRSKRTMVLAAICVLILILPSVLSIPIVDTYHVSVNNLPHFNAWGPLLYDVTISIDDVTENLTLAITFHKMFATPVTDLLVNSTNYGSIEVGTTIFSVPITSIVTLSFMASFMDITIEKVGYDGIINNNDDNVIVKGKTYAEEYQRYNDLTRQIEGYRAIVTVPADTRHSLTVDPLQGADLRYMTITQTGIYNYSIINSQQGVPEQSILPAGIEGIKISTPQSTSFRFELEFMPSLPETIQLYPDLFIDPEEITFSNSTPTEGDKIWINATLHNIGEEMAENFNVTAYYDLVTKANAIGVPIQFIALGPGDSAFIHFQWDTTDIYGDHVVRILVDEYNTVEEANETNHASRDIFIDDPVELDLDDDGDGLPNFWEIKYGLDPNNGTGQNGAGGDPDGDGFNNSQEYGNIVNPLDSDTDDDSLLDGCNNSLIELTLMNMTLKNESIPPPPAGDYYIMMSEYEVWDGSGYPYTGYRVPVNPNSYWNLELDNTTYPNETLSIAYVVTNMPLNVYYRYSPTPTSEFLITVNMDVLATDKTENITLNDTYFNLLVRATLLEYNFTDPDPLCKDADWDGINDSAEINYLPSRVLDFRDTDTDGDGVVNYLDVDSDNDNATDGMELGTYDDPLRVVCTAWPDFPSPPSITDPMDPDTDDDDVPDGNEMFVHHSDPLSPYSDNDTLNDGFEVNNWFVYANITMNRAGFYDNASETAINIEKMIEGKYRVRLYGTVAVKIGTDENLSKALNITLRSSTNTTIAYELVNDSHVVEENVTEIDIAYEFDFENEGDAVEIIIDANGSVFHRITDFRIYLNYSFFWRLGISPIEEDTDGDLLWDDEEVDFGAHSTKFPPWDWNCNRTAPGNSDTDFDHFWDRAELEYWENEYGLGDRDKVARAKITDFDNDKLVDGDEVIFGIDPTNADPDGDQINDYEELYQYVPMWRDDLSATITGYCNETTFHRSGSLCHYFEIKVRDGYMLKLVSQDTINRSREHYNNSLLNDDEYLAQINDNFVKEISIINVLKHGILLDLDFETKSKIVGKTIYGDYINMTERRYFTVTSRLIPDENYSITYDLDFMETNTTVILNFNQFVPSREGLHPFKVDIDGDGLPDGLEAKIGSNPFEPHSDDDAINDFHEYEGTYGYKTDPTKDDTDGDGLWDGYNISGEGVVGELSLGTNSTNVDTDGDTLWDGYNISGNIGELSVDTDPLKADTDNDTMPDDWEVKYAFRPRDATDANEDADSDNLFNAQEYTVDTIPRDNDTDDDGLFDGDEILGVLFRTNIKKGAISIENYEVQEGYKWIFYNLTEWKKYEYNNGSLETEKQVTVDGSTQNNAAIFGDYIVWQDNRNSSTGWDIYMFNLSSGEETRITTNASNQTNPAIYESHIVWQDDRNSSANWDIYIYNITSATEIRITNNTAVQECPVIYGDFVMWVDERNANATNGWQREIYMYNVKSGSEMRLTNDTIKDDPGALLPNQTHPWMNSPSVVWLDDKYNGPNVYLHQSSGDKYVTNDSFDQKNPRIYENTVVWEDYRNGNADIYMYDSAKDEWTQITANNSDQKNPSVFGDNILWEDYRHGNADIYLYNITTSVSIRLTNNSGNQTAPVAYKDRFVWVDDRNGNQDIYMYNLSFLLTLDDNSPIYYDNENNEIYVWKANAQFYRFNETSNSNVNTNNRPVNGYREMEFYEGPSPFDPDSDADGVYDGLEPYWNQDNDTDGKINALDTDSDADLVPDGREVRVGYRTNADDGEFDAESWAAVDTDVSDEVYVLEGFWFNASANDTNMASYTFTAVDNLETPQGKQVYYNESYGFIRIGPDTTYFAGNDSVAIKTENYGQAMYTAKRQETTFVVDSSADSDLIPNIIDSDSDNDGISDGTEPLWYQDIDHDGKINMFDTDSDGDKLADGTEDADCNGVVDENETSTIDVDTDNDGIIDSVELDWDKDADNDGLINAADFDADNDGVTDGNEARVVFRTNAINGEYNSTTWIAVALNESAWDPDTEPPYGYNLTGFWFNASSATPGGILLGYTFENDAVRYDAGSDTVYVDSTQFVLNGSGAIIKSTQPTLTFTKNRGESIVFYNISDGDETYNVLDNDSDDDNLLDGLEDLDNDGIIDADETDPYMQDTDKDMLPDGLEDADLNGSWDLGESHPLDVDTDDDGLWDGWKDIDSDCAYDPFEYGEDTNANGTVDSGETSPVMTDSDDDGLTDEEETVYGVYWMEAENWLSSGASKVLDGNASTGSEIAFEILTEGTYMMYVKARSAIDGGNYLAFEVRNFTNQLLVDANVYLDDKYHWFNTTLFNVTEDDLSVTIKVPTSGYDNDVCIDRVMLINVSDELDYTLMIDSVSDPTVAFEFEGNETVTIDVPGNMHVKSARMEAEPGFEEIQVTTSTFNEGPVIYKDKIVYQSYRESNWDIYMYNLSNDTEMRITANPHPQYSPDIYEDKIVWTDYKSGERDIYMYNLSNGTEIRITTDDLKQENPSIYGDIIAYDDYRNGNLNIYMYNLSNNTETQITDGDASQWGAKIYENKIIYHDHSTDNTDIYLYNISNGTEMRITTNGADQMYPAIYNNKIVYYDYRKGMPNADIYMYDLDTGIERQITTDLARQNHPDIYGDKIVWTDRRNPGAYNYDIYMYNLSTNTEYHVTVNETIQEWPSIYGNIVTWQDGRGGWNIFMSNLSSSINNLTLNVGNDTTTEWYHPGELYETESISEFMDALNKYITINRDEFENNSISIPLKFHSDATGKFKLTDVVITLEPEVTDPSDDDTDDDGLTDRFETHILATSALNADSDEDGLLDGTEYGLTLPQGNDTADTFQPDTDTSASTDPLRSDTDNDGIVDGYMDSDLDFTCDDGEAGEDRNANGNALGESETNATDPDTDDDGLTDGYGENWDGDAYLEDGETHPLDIDTDDDGLWDGYNRIYNDTFYFGELSLGTNSTNSDTDGDNLLDGTEIGLYHNPGNDSVMTDTEAAENISGDVSGTTLSKFVTDADSQNTTNPLDTDSDDDGVWDGFNDSNENELCEDSESGEDRNCNGRAEGEGETDAAHRDTDRDGLTDGYGENNDGDAISEEGETDPLDVDTDDDGLWDGYARIYNNVLYIGELSINTSSTNIDTDGDGLQDGTEVGLYYSATADSILTDAEANSLIPCDVYGTDLNYFTSDEDTSNLTNPLITDTDGDGLPDGWIDFNEDEYPQPTEGEDFSCNGKNDTYDITDGGIIDETIPHRIDSDRDGINDTYEVMNNVHWFEAEDNLISGASVVDNGDASTGVKVTMPDPSIPEGASYMFYVKANTTVPDTQLTFGVYDASSSICDETVTLTDEYTWYNTTAFDIAVDDLPVYLYAPYPSANANIYVEKVMLVMISDGTGYIPIITSASGSSVEFEGSGSQTLYIDVPQNMYVKKAGMNLIPVPVSDDDVMITPDNDHQYNPAIYGDMIVWEDYRNDTDGQWLSGGGTDGLNNGDIYLFNLTTWEEMSICTNNAEQADPQIYGDIVVWADYRADGTNGDIYMYNLKTHTESAVTTNSYHQECPAIHGDNIVWEDWRDGNAEIYLKNLSTGQERRITNEAREQTLPAIWGSRIVWRDYRNLNYDIYMYDLSTGMEIGVCTQGAAQNNPAIYDRRIVYQDGRNDNGDIYMFDLANGKETRITTHAAKQWYPAIFRDKILWTDQRDSNYGEVYMYDLAIEREILINCVSTGTQKLPAIYEDKMVWQDWRRTGGPDIFLRNITFTVNATLNVGNDADIEWHHSAKFFEIDSAPDFSDEINEYIFNNQADFTGGTLSVPLTFYSNSSGRIDITELYVVLTPDVSCPMDNDTDSDKLLEGYEKNHYYTLSLSVDSDSDLLRDYEEIMGTDEMHKTGTHPAHHDTDNDGLWDGFEDINNNGVLDSMEEVGEDVNLNYYVDANETHPLDPDSDNDALVDGVESIPDVLWFEAEDYTIAQIISDENASFGFAVENLTGIELIDEDIFPTLPAGDYMLWVRAKSNNTISQYMEYFSSGMGDWTTTDSSTDVNANNGYLKAEGGTGKTASAKNSTKSLPSSGDYIIEFDYRYPMITKMNRFLVWATYENPKPDIEIWQSDDKLYANGDSIPFASLTNTIWHHFEIVSIKNDSFEIYLDDALVYNSTKLENGSTPTFGMVGDIANDYEGKGNWDNIALVETTHLNVTVRTSTSGVIWDIFHAFDQYRWYYISPFTIGGDGKFEVDVNDSYSSKAAVHVDKLMLVKILDPSALQVTGTNDSDDVIVFHGNDTITTYIDLKVKDTVPLYVVRATMDIAGEAHDGVYPTYPYLNIGGYDNISFPRANQGVKDYANCSLESLENMTLPQWAWYFGEFKPANGTQRLLDFSGELNQYIRDNKDLPGRVNESGYMRIPLEFNSDTAGKLILSNILIILAPYATDALSNDTDGDLLLDGDESLLWTYSLKWDSDNDGLYDVVEAVETIGTNPLDSDSENDLLMDGNSDELKVIFRAGNSNGEFDGYNVSSWIALQNLIFVGELGVYAPSTEQFSSRLIGYGYNGKVSSVPNPLVTWPVVFNTSEDYGMYYDNTTGHIYVEINENNYRRYEKTDSDAQNAYNLTQPTVRYALNKQEVYSNAALTADKDGDGLIDGIEPMLGLSTTDADCDDDGLLDGIEYYLLGTSPSCNDSEGDHIQDGTELGLSLEDVFIVKWSTETNTLIWGTNPSKFQPDLDPGTTTSPLRTDSDYDGIWDGYNDANGNDVLDSTDPGEDRNCNGKAEGENESDATNPDTDGDGLLDGYDENKDGDASLDSGETSPVDVDTDDDGLWDGYTVMFQEKTYLGELSFGTDPRSTDSDSDDIQDGTEVGLFFSSSTPSEDNILDNCETEEIWASLKGTDVTDFISDEDILNVTKPTIDDTDGDGLIDGDEDENYNGRFEDNKTETDPLNKDTDFDGIWDGIEDENHDGFFDTGTDETDPNDCDTDDDGLRDGEERDWDEDSDGDDVKNALDDDSDNDDVIDGVEAGITAAEKPTGGYGYVGTGTYGGDADPDTTTDYLDPDTDDDGLKDGDEDENFNGWFEDNKTETDPLNKDTDFDKIADGDEDYNKDGDYDANGADGTAGTLDDELDPNDCDTDDDGIRDGQERNWDEDTDEDKVINALDDDSDDDGLIDGVEAGISSAEKPAAGYGYEGTGTYSGDDDPETTTDPLDSDTDNDGLIDGIEDGNANGLFDESPIETDPNNEDTDFDGLSDGEEDYNKDGDFDQNGNDGQPNTLDDELNPNDCDTDDDGLKDGEEDLWSSDSDEDDVINALDSDSDDDHIVDGVEAGVSTANKPAGGYGYEGTGGSYSGDTDTSTTTDPLDADTDDDGIPDGWIDGWTYTRTLGWHEGGSKNTNEDAWEGEDLDCDGAFEPVLESKSEIDPNSADTDGDGIPDGFELVLCAIAMSVSAGLNPLNKTDAYEDIDGDSLFNIEEYEQGINSNDLDIDADNDDKINFDDNNDDNDEWPTECEVGWGLDPYFDEYDNQYDFDGDGLGNKFEWDEREHINLTSADSDGDGLEDGWEYDYWKNTRGKPPAEALDYCSDSDVDNDNIIDGKEINGYKVTICWYEGEDLKSKEITVYGDPLFEYQAPNNGPFLDVDGDGIYDADEADPVNSTRLAWYFEVLKHDPRPQSEKDEQVQNQFNPLIREAIPPKIENVDIKTDVKTRWKTVVFVPIFVVEHCWTKVRVEITDVSDYTVKIKVLDNGKSKTFSGNGNQVFEATLDIDYWTDYLIDYRVKVTAEDVAGNDIKFEKKINGFFGGLLDALAAIWNAIAGFFTAAFELMMAALNFIVDLIMKAVQAIIDAVLSPIMNAIEGFIKGFEKVIDGAVVEINKANPTYEYHKREAGNEIWNYLTSGNFFYLLIALVTGCTAAAWIGTIALKAFTAGADTLADKIIDMIAKAFIVGIVGVVGFGVGATTYFIEILFNNVIAQWKPGSDAFWQEGVGLTLITLAMTVLSIAGGMIFGGASLLGALFGDAFGLICAIIGLFCAFFMSNVYGAILGVAFATFGMGYTLLKEDALDKTGGPIRFFEETIALISLGAAWVNFYDNVLKIIHEDH